MNSDGVRVAVLLFALLAGCATPGGPRIESDRADDADFTRYATYAWAKPATVGTAEAPLRLFDVNVRNAIRAALGKRGYQEQTEAPDLLIDYETLTQDKVKSNPVRIGIGMGSWGGNVGGSIGLGSPSVESYQEGRLVIRAVDARANREVWVASVVDRMQKDGLDANEVTRVVELTLRDFPTRTAPVSGPP
jgi:hypothetical protein